MPLRRAASGRPGFLLLEALIGFALFALFLSAVGLTLVVVGQGTAAAGDRSRAVGLASGALDAVRAMRDHDWSGLMVGTYGVAVENGVWTQSGASTVTDDGFTTAVTVASVAPEIRSITARTHWTHGSSSGSIALSTELTDWRTPMTVGNWAAPVLVGSHTTTATTQYGRVAAGNGFAYVTGDISAGGKGLYLFDLSVPSSPAPAATGFDLGVTAHDVLVIGDRLAVVTEDPSQEIRFYDIADPSAFGEESLLGSYDLPGSGLARSLALQGDTLIVGAMQNDDAELFLLDIADPADVSLLSSLEIGASVLGLSLSGNVLYCATDDDASELRVADIGDIVDPSAPTGSGYNLTDSSDALSVAVTGTSAVLGRMDSAFVEELALFDLEGAAVPAPPPGPWYREAVAAVRGLAVDFSQHYAFAATLHPGSELTVLDLHAWTTGGDPVVATQASATGEGRGVFYDAAADRLYHVTQQGFFLYRPS